MLQTDMNNNTDLVFLNRIIERGMKKREMTLKEVLPSKVVLNALQMHQTWKKKLKSVWRNFQALLKNSLRI